MAAAPAPGIVIVGAGECGTRAAFALREEGWDGPLILAGAEQAPPYERPPLSKTWHRAAGGTRPGRAGRPRRAPQVPAPRAGRYVMK